MKCDHFDSMDLFFKYTRSFYPEVNKQRKKFIEKCCSFPEIATQGPQNEDTSCKNLLLNTASIFTMYPGVDITTASGFFVFLTAIDKCSNCRRFSGEMSKSRLYFTLSDAVDPNKTALDLENSFKIPDDSCLYVLINDMKERLLRLPAFPLVKERLKKYAWYYFKQQAFINLQSELKKEGILSFSAKHKKDYLEISDWEFAAASNSAIVLFMLYAAANDKDLKEEEAEDLDSVYFPWVSGLHILLEHYINLQQDLESRAFNFTRQYKNQKDCEDRIAYFMERALQGSIKLRYPDFHTRIIKGLMALYLSDPKAHSGLNYLTSKNLLKNGFPGTKSYYNVCRLLRSVGKL